MSYTKREWATGNVVGAVDLNRIENGIADIDVDEIRGWSMQNTQLFSETVTTAQSPYGYAAQLTYAFANIPPLTMTITLNGTDYNCTRQAQGNAFYYGAPPMDFSTYPFTLLIESSSIIMTQTAGTYTISAIGEVIEVSDRFSDAVKKSVNADSIPLNCVDGETTLNEMGLARRNNQLMYFSDGQAFYFINDFISAYDRPSAVTFYPTTTDFTAGFDSNGIFTLYWS